MPTTIDYDKITPQEGIPTLQRRYKDALELTKRMEKYTVNTEQGVTAQTQIMDIKSKKCQVLSFAGYDVQPSYEVFQSEFGFNCVMLGYKKAKTGELPTSEMGVNIIFIQYWEGQYGLTPLIKSEEGDKIMDVDYTRTTALCDNIHSVISNYLKTKDNNDNQWANLPTAE